MKFLKLLVLCNLLFIFSICSAQSDDQIKLNNLKYYLSYIKDQSQAMRFYTDSVKIIRLLDQLDLITSSLDDELNKIVLAPALNDQQNDTYTDTSTTDDIIQQPENTWKNNDTNQTTDEGSGASRFIPFGNKIKVKLRIQAGINILDQGKATSSSALVPELNTAGSWYWDFAVLKQVRLGSKDSRVSLNYGISYLINRFKIENDLRLTTNDDGNPEYIRIVDANNDPKLNIGYLNIPVSVNVAISKYVKLELGGYAGYRIHTVQKLQLKKPKEVIYENRYSSYQLNNWLYGVSAALNLSGVHITARYNVTHLFKDNPLYDYNTFMIGTFINLL